MAIKVGDKLPEGKLNETEEFDAGGCAINPKEVNVVEAVVDDYEGVSFGDT